MSKVYSVYIITNYLNSTFYVGITNDIERRIVEHKLKIKEGFSSKYNLNKLVYYEQTQSVIDAIAREKQLKNWHRKWKIDLIKKENPSFRDLSDSICWFFILNKINRAVLTGGWKAWAIFTFYYSSNIS